MSKSGGDHGLFVTIYERGARFASLSILLAFISMPSAAQTSAIGKWTENG